RAGLPAAIVACGALCLAAAAAVALFAVDPPRRRRDAQDTRETRTARNPYRSPVLWRIHAASTLLVVPQFATTGFAPEYLGASRGWSAADAGARRGGG